MYRTEAEANMNGFTSYNVSRKANVKASVSFNYIKALQYAAVLLMIAMWLYH